MLHSVLGNRIPVAGHDDGLGIIVLIHDIDQSVRVAVVHRQIQRVNFDRFRKISENRMNRLEILAFGKVSKALAVFVRAGLTAFGF